VRVWDVASGQPVTPLIPHNAFGREGGRLTPRPEMATLSPDNRRLLTIDGGDVRLWETRTGHPLAPPLKHGGAVWHASFVGDGNRLVTASGPVGRVWDLTPDDRPMEELVLLARMLAGRSLDVGGGLVPLEFSEFQALWERVRPQPEREAGGKPKRGTGSPTR
jgi:hypothetical protein